MLKMAEWRIVGVETKSDRSQRQPLTNRDFVFVSLNVGSAILTGILRLPSARGWNAVDDLDMR